MGRAAPISPRRLASCLAAQPAPSCSALTMSPTDPRDDALLRPSPSFRVLTPRRTPRFHPAPSTTRRAPTSLGPLHCVGLYLAPPATNPRCYRRAKLDLTSSPRPCHALSLSVGKDGIVPAVPCAEDGSSGATFLRLRSAMRTKVTVAQSGGGCCGSSRAQTTTDCTSVRGQP